ncbi:MAG: hypothetical protein ACT4PM_14040 [Gemmatimonadales bacterium]
MRSRLASLEPPAPCARCERRVPGLKWGDLCPDCLAELRRRATPLARIISLVFVAVVIGYAWLRIPLTLTTRLWVAGIAVATYFLVRKIAIQIAVEFMRR